MRIILDITDEELVEQLRENPYYQYFIGMPGYEDKYPFVPSLLVEFRKRLSEEILSEVNEIIISSAMSEKDDSDDDNNSNCVCQEKVIHLLRKK